MGSTVQRSYFHLVYLAQSPWRSMSGGLASRRPPSPSNAYFAYPIRANKLNISSGMVLKLGGHGGGPRLLCMNFVGGAIMIASVGNKSSSRNGSLKSMAKRLKFGTSLEVLPFGPFKLNAMTKSSTMNNGMKLGSNIAFGINSHVCQNGLGTGTQTNRDMHLLGGGYASRF